MPWKLFFLIEWKSFETEERSPEIDIEITEHLKFHFSDEYHLSRYLTIT